MKKKKIGGFGGLPGNDGLYTVCVRAFGREFNKSKRQPDDDEPYVGWQRIEGGSGFMCKGLARKVGGGMCIM
jgi:hypothetical protein